MKSKADAKKRTEMLKQLRDQHKESVARTQELLKEHKKIQQQICQVLRSEPKTVPELAENTGWPAHQILWHVTALKKYGSVQETGMCGDYYLYEMVKESSG